MSGFVAAVTDLTTILTHHLVDWIDRIAANSSEVKIALVVALAYVSGALTVRLGNKGIHSTGERKTSQSQIQLTDPEVEITRRERELDVRQANADAREQELDYESKIHTSQQLAVAFMRSALYFQEDAARLQAEKDSAEYGGVGELTGQDLARLILGNTGADM